MPAVPSALAHSACSLAVFGGDESEVGDADLSSRRGAGPGPLTPCWGSVWRAAGTSAVKTAGNWLVQLNAIAT